jgi:cytoplasmic iron level regulating protein YaaA (DUF328/UPF0246 family)
MKKLREGQGRSEIFVRGSEAARAHMAKLRAMPRKAKAPKEGGAAPKKARAPSARAAIVKQVMQSEGLSMIEASKYVKANGLYTPK